MQVAASVGMLRLLLSMFGRRPLVLVLLAGYLFWVFTLPASVWWAAGINQLPLQIALVFGLHAHIAYLRDRQVRHLVLALLWVAFGLLFYEKTVLILGIYGLVALCWFSSGRTPQRLRGLWDRYRLAIIVYVVVGGAYLAIYATYGLNFSPGETADVSWGPIAWNLVAVAMGSALIGGPIEWQSLSVGSFANPPDWVLVASWAAVGAMVFYASRSRTISNRAWSLLAFTSLGNIALLASARANVVGPEIAREYRYQTEAAAVAVLGIGLAFLPLLGATEQNAVRPDAPQGYEDRRLIAAIVAVVVAFSALSSVRYVDLWQDRNPTKSYITNVESSLKKASAAADGAEIPLVDAGVPQSLLWSYRYPENTYSHLFKPWADLTTYPRNSIDDLFMFDDAGTLAPVGLSPARLMAEPEDAPQNCTVAMQDGVTVIPLDGPVIGGGWWIALNYKSPVDTHFRLVAGDEAHDVEAPAGKHTAWFQAAGTFDEVKIDSFPEDTGLCIQGLVLGSPFPAGGSTG